MKSAAAILGNVSGHGPKQTANVSAKGAVDAVLPTVSEPMLSWFTWYSRRYIRRHFHSLRVSVSGLPPETEGWPLVLYTNHASWWDPLACLVVKSEFFPDRTGFAPIDSTALQRYKLFGRLGFFGVEQGTRRGAVQFLRTSEAVLRNLNHLLAITPQGRFADTRERPLKFQAGLGHLATRVNRALFLPMALEYVFWEERLPELLVRFGEPVAVRPSRLDRFQAAEWNGIFEEKLAATQDALALESQRRDLDDFQMLLRGGSGQGGIYDAWRALLAAVRGQNFRKEHGTK